MTWPLALHMRDSTPSAYQDSRHIVWLLAWDAHVLRTDPTDLFQAPHFWPEPDVLSYTDHVMGLGVFAAPIIWTTGNPYLAHNLVFIGAITFSGWAAFLLAFDLTKSRAASLVGGAAFAFAPYWFGPIINLSHLQTIASGWIPLALLGLHRWIRSRGWRHLALLAVSFVMGTLTSWYESVFLLVAIAVSAPFLLWSARPLAWRRLALQGLTAAVVVGAILGPFALPYQRSQDRFPTTYTRRLDEAENFSARASSYLSAPTSNALYGGISERWRNQQRTLESDLFPGITVVLLAGAGVLWGRGRGLRPGAIAAFGAVGVTGLILAFGGGGNGYRRFLPWTFLFDHVTFFRGLRAPARIHVLTLIMLSVLAALGARLLLERIPRRPVLRALLVPFVIGLIVLEGAAVPINLGPAVKIPRAFAALATRPGAILELPTGFHVSGRNTWSQTRKYDVDYMLLGTAHWRPLVNGFSSFEPPSYAPFMDAMSELPDPLAMALLRSYRVRTIVLHTDLTRGTPWFGLEDRLDGVSGVHLISRSGRILFYDVGPE